MVAATPLISTLGRLRQVDLCCEFKANLGYRDCLKEKSLVTHTFNPSIREVEVVIWLVGVEHMQDQV